MIVNSIFWQANDMGVISMSPSYAESFMKIKVWVRLVGCQPSHYWYQCNAPKSWKVMKLVMEMALGV